MKKFFIILFLCLVYTIIQAQENKETKKEKDTNSIRTLAGNDTHNGGYLGIGLGFGQIAHQNGFSTNARFAWIVNHSIALGISGTAFISSNPIDNVVNGNEILYNTAGIYGGFLVEPIIMAKNPIHISLPFVIGGGWLYHENYPSGTANYNLDDYHKYNDMFTVFEPGIELELNLVKFIRLSAGINYRFTFDVNVPDLANNKLNGYNYVFCLKFGRF